MLANVNKTAGDIAYDAVRAHIIFKRIIVYGLLIDYKERHISKIYKVVLDFVNGETTTLESSDKEFLGLTEGFSRVTAIMQQSLATI